MKEIGGKDGHVDGKKDKSEEEIKLQEDKSRKLSKKKRIRRNFRQKRISPLVSFSFRMHFISSIFLFIILFY